MSRLARIVLSDDGGRTLGIVVHTSKGWRVTCSMPCANFEETAVNPADGVKVLLDHIEKVRGS